MDADHGWGVMGWGSWTDLTQVRERLAAGADPDHIDAGLWSRPLHLAADNGTGEVVAELAAHVSDVDALDAARSALWVAVYQRQTSAIDALLAAGADPWRPMMAGWSPGRLALAGPDAALFATTDTSTSDTAVGGPGARALSPAETEVVARSARLSAVLADLPIDGLSLAVVAGIDAREAIRRLQATPDDRLPTNADAADQDLDPQQIGEDVWELALDHPDGTEPLVGVSDVLGGCIITQPWGYAANMPGVQRLLSAGTRCYGLYANPKSGNQGSTCLDGRITGWDLHPGGPANAEDPADLVLISFLHRLDAVGYACAYAGLQLNDARPVTGPADHWVRLPKRDYWTEV